MHKLCKPLNEYWLWIFRILWHVTRFVLCIWRNWSFSTWLSWNVYGKKSTPNIINIRGRVDGIFTFENSNSIKFELYIYSADWTCETNQKYFEFKQRIRNKSHKIAIEPIQNVFWMCNEWRWLCSHGDYSTQFEFLQTINKRTHAQRAVPKVICSAQFLVKMHRTQYTFQSWPSLLLPKFFTPMINFINYANAIICSF